MVFFGINCKFGYYDLMVFFGINFKVGHFYLMLFFGINCKVDHTYFMVFFSVNFKAGHPYKTATCLSWPLSYGTGKFLRYYTWLFLYKLGMCVP